MRIPRGRTALRKRVSTPPGKTRRQYKAEDISMTTSIKLPDLKAGPRKASATAAALSLLNRPCASNGLPAAKVSSSFPWCQPEDPRASRIRLITEHARMLFSRSIDVHRTRDRRKRGMWCGHASSPLQNGRTAFVNAPRKMCTAARLGSNEKTKRFPRTYVRMYMFVLYILYIRSTLEWVLPMHECKSWWASHDGAGVHMRMNLHSYVIVMHRFAACNTPIWHKR